MPRTYSKDLIEKLGKLRPFDTTGVQLAKACVRANLPAKYVAAALEVTRMTVHSWFRGNPIRENNRRMAAAFTSLVEQDLDDGILPAKTTAHAKKYIEEMIGRQIQAGVTPQINRAEVTRLFRLCVYVKTIL